MRARAAIAGIGQTEFGRLPDRTPLSMNVEAIRLALEDAGIEKGEVDALFVKVPTSQYSSMYGQTLAEAVGMQPRIGGVWDQGGATNISMIGFAAMAIDAGQCETAVISIADNPKTGTRQAYEKAWGDDAVHGWFSVAAGYAMIARRHMGQYGTTAAHLGAVAMASRNHGAANPRAQLRRPLTMDGYMASPWVVEPLRRDDICLVSDGGAAVVVTSRARAGGGGIPILGFGQGQTSWDVAQRPVLTTTCAAASAHTAFAMAGLTPADIDVAQLYDCFTIVPLMTLEDYGFCAKGEGGRFVSDGRLQIGGDLPMNTAGGLLSETGMPGMQLVLEAVRQMRGTAITQVPGAHTCIVSNQGGIMHTHATLILGQ